MAELLMAQGVFFGLFCAALVALPLWLWLSLRRRHQRLCEDVWLFATSLENEEEPLDGDMVAADLQALVLRASGKHSPSKEPSRAD